MKRTVAGMGVLLGAVACDPRTFDDLKSEAWVQIAERNETETGGDFGTNVIAMPPPSTGGARFVVAVGSPSGLAQITLNAAGDIDEQIGYNGDVGGRGALQPLEASKSPSDLVPLSGDQFLVGVASAGDVIRYEAGLQAGVAIIDSGDTATGLGNAVAVGDLGVGTSAPEVVAVGTTSLTVLEDGDMTKTRRTCGLKPPNASNAPPVHLQNVVITTLGSEPRIVVSSTRLDNSGVIYVIDPGAIQNGQNCPDTGFSVPTPPPVALVIANLDANAAPEIVTGSLGMSGVTGKVRIYMNVTGAGEPSMMEVPLGMPSAANPDPSDDERSASSAHGSRILIGNIGEGSEPEILVGDPNATVDGVSAAGRVNIYRMGGTCDPAAMRGPLCLVRTLFDPDPDRNSYFGRAMTIAPFSAGGTSTNILAVAERAKLWIYFRVFTASADPRQ